MKDALMRSGYLLESRVSAYLRGRGLRVTCSPTFADATTGRSREIDLEASGLHSDIHPHYPDEMAWAQLLIECVNPPHPLVFFMGAQPDEWDSGYERIRIAGPPTQQPPEQLRYNWYWLLREIDASRCHHYFAPGLVATQYCSFDKKKSGDGRGQWFAQHREQDHETLRALVNATDFLSHQQHSHMGEDYPWLQLVLFFPVLVVQGELLEATPTKRSVRLARTEYVRLHWSRSEGRESYRYVIDVVTERYLPRYLDLVAATMDAFAARISARAPAVFMDAIDRAAEMRGGHPRDSSSPIPEVTKQRAAAELEQDRRDFDLDGLAPS